MKNNRLIDMMNKFPSLEDLTESERSSRLFNYLDPEKLSGLIIKYPFLKNLIIIEKPSEIFDIVESAAEDIPENYRKAEGGSDDGIEYYNYSWYGVRQGGFNRINAPGLDFKILIDDKFIESNYNYLVLTKEFANRRTCDTTFYIYSMSQEFYEDIRNKHTKKGKKRYIVHWEDLEDGQTGKSFEIEASDPIEAFYLGHEQISSYNTTGCISSISDEKRISHYVDIFMNQC